jgi:hypothetical protein
VGGKFEIFKFFRNKIGFRVQVHLFLQDVCSFPIKYPQVFTSTRKQNNNWFRRSLLSISAAINKLQAP